MQRRWRLQPDTWGEGVLDALGGAAYREYGSKAVYCITVRMRSSEGASSIPLPRKDEYPDQSTVEYE